MLPDYAMLQENPDLWRILVSGDRAMVRRPDGTGFSAPLSRLTQLLNIGQDLESGSPTRSVQWIRPADASTAKLSADWQVDEQLVRDPLEYLAADAAKAPLNMLQDEFRPVQQDSWNWRPWATAALLAFVAIGIGLVKTGLETARLNREFRQLQASMTELAKEALPEMKQIRDPQAQMLSAWRQLNTDSAGGAEFLPLLDRVTATISQQPLTVNGIHFKDGTLTVALQGTSLQQLDNLRQQIELSGLHATLLNASTDTDSARSDLVISTTASPGSGSAG